jgi:hypothetical protein
MTLREKNTIAREYQLRIPLKKANKVKYNNEKDQNILNNYEHNN